MGFSRKFLEALGIDEAKVQTIIDAHTESLEGIKSDRDKYKAEADKYADVQKQLADYQTQLDDANKQLTAAQKQLDDNAKADYKGQLEAKEKELETLKNDYAAKETAANKRAALKDSLKQKGYSETAVNLIIRNGFADKVEITDGKASNLDAVISEIQSDADFSGFTPKPSDTSHKPATPPANSGGTAITKESILAEKDMSKQLELVSQNLELFQS